MILVQSISKDVSTSLTCSWLKSINAEFLVLNEFHEIEVKQIDENDSVYILKTTEGEIIKEFSLSEVKSYWYRRGKANVFHNSILKESNEDPVISINSELERNTYSEFFDFQLSLKPRIDCYSKSSANKLIINAIAKQYLNVPPYLCNSNKDEVIRFIEKNGRAIVKTPAEYFENCSEPIVSYTKEVTTSDLEDLQINFGVSYFQKLIEKKFEIRSFYLDGTFYSVAIFSQTNEKTQIDFRNYDNKLPNRQVPFLLPKEIQDSTRKIIAKLGLVSCSIDYIYGTDNQIYFLEINPIGQFGPVSYYGNFYIERKIADYLYEIQ